MQGAGGKFDLDAASDPVCGSLVNIRSPYRADYGGKDLYFCSEQCLGAFIADPWAFEGEGTIMLARDASLSRLLATRSAAQPAQTVRPLPAPAAAAPATRSGNLRAEVFANGTQRGALPTAQPKVSIWPFGWLGDWFFERAERRFIAAVSRQLLLRFLALAGEQPATPRLELYRRLIMDRLECDAAAADRLLQQATESFAQWPKLRALQLRDVVHTLSIAEFTASHMETGGQRCDVGKLVAVLIPANL
jgi:YHS domain-containing protein